MSLTEVPEFTPAREMPNGKLFYSPLGLFEFQVEAVAELYVRTDPNSAHNGSIGSEKQSWVWHLLPTFTRINKLIW
jgi:hypothetical protein